MSDRLNADLADISKLLEKHLHLTGEFSKIMRKAGKHVPRKIRKRMNLLVEAAHIQGHPRLAQTLDEAALKVHARVVKQHLAQINLGDRRKGKVLEIAGTCAFSLLVVLALLFLVLRWRGFV